MDKSKIDKNDLEDFFNDTLSNLKVFARDVNLSDKQFSSYKIGQIILERGYIDATIKKSGMSTSHRYTIISNHFADFRSFEHGTDWGLFVGNSGSRFKVLDIFHYADKTQILLLHLPNKDSWKYAKITSSNIENELIDKNRKSFIELSTSVVDPALATDEWINRCKFPLGMDDDGNLFEIEYIFDDVNILETYIAGTSYIKDIDDLVESISIGDRLRLKREANNKHDSNAIILLTTDGKKLGYISKSENQILSNLIAAGKILYASIDSIEDKGNWYKIGVKIYLRTYNI